MKRRDFIKKSIVGGIAAGTALTFNKYSGVFAGNGFTPESNFDLIAIKGGEPGIMFDKAIESLGGMSSFISKNQTVVVKPNIGWDCVPEKAANTNPALVGRIIEHCFNAGAKEVYVFDNTCNKWNKCYENSGIEKAVKDAGGKIVPAHTENYYHEVNITQGKKLTKAKVHELILESDVFINVPILKDHSSTDLTIAMKNLMGIVWDRMYWHKNDLHQCIADFSTFIKPDLNIIDAYRVMKENGPRGVSVDDVVIYKTQIISTDIVAADAAATKIFGMEPEDIAYINIADEMKIGTKNLENLSINRINL
ncbi:MAG: DUF362 domain-containing protein [Bacteroidales bacterium]|nr:DUF362 domain-containing protein [Bacteroidales bacterium]